MSRSAALRRSVARAVAAVRDRRRRSGAPGATPPTGSAADGGDQETATSRAARHRARGEDHLACRQLEAALAVAPSDGPLHRALAGAARELAVRGGAFEAPADAAGGAVWWSLASLVERHPDVATLRDPRQAAVVAAERAVELEPDRVAWWGLLLEVCVTAGRTARAVEVGEQLAAQLNGATGTWVDRSRHRWEFLTERARYQLGRGRVEDPLFDVEVRPIAATGALQDPPGVAQVQVDHQGLRVAGAVVAGATDRIQVRLDDDVVRTVNLGRDAPVATFALVLRRATLARLPTSCRVQVVTGTGQVLPIQGHAEQVEVRCPTGDGTWGELRAAGVGLDKKGMLGRRAGETAAVQGDHLRLYATARDAFAELGRSLFAFHGTLLGIHRDGDLLPDDDDFDVGYLSDADDPTGVRDEAVAIIEALVARGFTVSVNRRGRLFRLHHPDIGPASFHLDVHPVWSDGTALFAANHLRMVASRDAFVPTAEVEVRGTRVLVPRDPEAFLESNYGPGWRTPDPGSVDDDTGVPAEVVETIARASLSPRHQHELRDRIAAARAVDPGSGRFVPIASQPLYPLQDLIE